MNFKEGAIIYVNKPYGWTSFGVVNKVRYFVCRKQGVKKMKVGHAGTLDPLATGVMILCTGKATKRIEEFQYQTKEYIATIRLGATTPSFDLEKEIDATYPTDWWRRHCGSLSAASSKCRLRSLHARSTANGPTTWHAKDAMSNSSPRPSSSTKSN